MTDRAQFEAMLEALINEDHESAKEIFHNIVVGKSREIYEELLESDFSQDSGNPYAKHEEEEESMEEDEMEEDEMEEDEMEEEGAEEEESDDEEGDDSEADSEENPFASDAEGDDAEGGDMEDRVMDLEDALEDLKAEFEQLLAGEEHEEENEPGIHGDEMPMHDLGADMHGDMDELETMMEYVVKVGNPKHGDNGANTKSTIDNMKNDMGGSAANIAQNFSTTTGGTKGGLLKPTTGDLVGQEIHNRPGTTAAGKKGFKKSVEGGGLDRQNSFKAKGNMAGARSGELGGQRGEQNTQSLLRPLKK